MATPGKVHYLLAVLLYGLVAAIGGLAVVRYVEYGREIRLTVFQGLTSSLGLASRAQGVPQESMTATLEAEAQRLLENDDSVSRVFVLKKGELVPGYNFPRPARFLLDVKREEGPMESRERLLTLVARLDDASREDARGIDHDPHVLSWFHTTDNVTRLVAAWPLHTNGAYAGVVGVERVPVPAGPVLVVSALGLLASLGLLFLLGLRLRWSPRLSLSVAMVLVLAATAALLGSHSFREGSKFALGRDTAATLAANEILQGDRSLMNELDPLWKRVFLEKAERLSLSVVPQTDGQSSVVLLERAAALGQLGLQGTWPAMAVLLFVLLLAVWGLHSTAGLVWGLHRMPGVYAYVAPAMLGMLVLVLVPFLMGIGLGFFNRDFEFVGFENFSNILFPTQTSDTNFYFTLGVTILWTVSNVVLHVAIGLALALVLVSPKVRFKGLFRVLLIVPWAVPNYITALIWKWMFTSEIGAISIVCKSLGIGPENWLGNSFWANYFANLATNVWLGFPFMMVVSMGALQSIPNELYEAAEIDGASRWQKFRNVTLPLLKPALFPAIILGSIWTFNMFNVIYLVSRGNPDNKTNILITEAYRFFNELNQYGVAAAYCVLIFVILLLYTVITNRVTRATQGAFE